jgi:hypothetical protein
MKTYLMAAVFVCAALISAQANLLTNPNFNLDTNGVPFADTEVLHGWSQVLAWSGSGGDTRGAQRDDYFAGIAHPTADMAGWVGVWGNPWGHFIRQDSGVIAQPNTQYEFTIDLINNNWWRTTMGFQVVDAGVWGTQVNAPNFAVPGGAWNTFSFTLDTAVNPEFVGKSIGVHVTSRDSDGGFIMATNASLVAIPEPATFGLVAAFGGAMMLIRRKIMI